MEQTVNSMNIQTQYEQPDPRAREAEQLSALIDGELSADQARLAIQRIGQGSTDRARLSEYVAIGDAMRGLSAQHGDFTRRVMARLEKEPVLLAPTPTAAPGKSERRPVLWLAAATAAVITWGLWQSSPRDEVAVPLAAVQPAVQDVEAMPYLAAHEDFAQAVISAPEMRFTKASLEVNQ
jgi:anti-sigma factor RsiW